MLRRSWLILLTARPSWARRFFWISAWESCCCMRASSRSAVPISSERPEGTMMRLASSGLWLKLTMERVMRIMGRTSRLLSAR